MAVGTNRGPVGGGRLKLFGCVGGAVVLTAKALGCVGGLISTMVISVSTVGPSSASAGIEGFGKWVSWGSIDRFAGFR